MRQYLCIFPNTNPGPIHPGTDTSAAPQPQQPGPWRHHGMKQQTSHNTKSKLPLSASTTTSTPSPFSWSCLARLGLSQGASHGSARVRGEELLCSHQACHRSCQAFPLAWERKHLHKGCYNSTWQEARERSDIWLGELSPSFMNPLLGDIRRKQCCDKQAGQGVALPSPISILSRWML